MSVLDEEIVVLVKHRNTYHWFVSERDFWVLDQDSWRRAFVAAGYGDGDPSYAERFGIAVVNESNATDFLKLMGQYAVDVEALRVARTVDGDIAYPSLFVDFGEKQIEICGVESPAFESYLPPGWHAEIATFLDVVPEGLRYWPPSEELDRESGGTAAMTCLPQQICIAMQRGYWKDPGSNRLSQILNIESTDPLILLSREKMESTKRQIAAGGYVEDPQFCLVANIAELRSPEDHRVSFSHLLFIVTSSRTGDDVFCAIDLSERSLSLLWLDWTRPVPERWRRVMSLTEFLTHLSVEAYR